MNRAMLLTPSGSGAIAVIRAVGPAVGDFLRQCFDRPTGQGRCVYGRVRDGERVIDDAVAVVNEEGVELNVHGGLWVVHEVLALLGRHGFEIVRWSPEQTWGAEGQTVLEREIMATLPQARTELAVNVLLNQKHAWSGLLANPPKRDELQFILADRSLHWLLNPPNVAIIGLPNVGKSTIANQLFGQERSITADVPGTTRDWVGELANIDGLIVKLIDTPGQRRGGDVIEDSAIEAAQPIIASADLVVVVIDPTQDMKSQDELLLRWSKAVVVVNKSDCANWDGAGIRTIATRSVGIDELRSGILRRFGMGEINQNAPRCWTNRQRDEIRKILG